VSELLFWANHFDGVDELWKGKNLLNVFLAYLMLFFFLHVILLTIFLIIEFYWFFNIGIKYFDIYKLIMKSDNWILLVIRSNEAPAFYGEPFKTILRRILDRFSWFDLFLLTTKAVYITIWTIRFNAHAKG
jgi:hypothetical protein